jgi:hypothetical protein
MKKRDENIIIFSIAVVFSITFCLSLINFIYTNNYSAIFWVCYVTLPIMVIGLLKRNSNIILSQLIIFAIPDLLWIFDFIYWTFSGHSLIGLANFFPKGGFIEKLSSVQHLYTVPLSLMALSILKLKKNYKILLISFGELVLIFFFTLFFIPLHYVNCIDLSCTNISLTFLPYYIIWFMFAFSFATISYFIINSLPFRNKI